MLHQKNTYTASALPPVRFDLIVVDMNLQEADVPHLEGVYTYQQGLDLLL